MRTDSVRVKPIAMLIRTLLGKYTIETMAPLLIIFLILFGSLGTGWAHNACGAGAAANSAYRGHAYQFRNT